MREKIISFILSPTVYIHNDLFLEYIINKSRELTEKEGFERDAVEPVTCKVKHIVRASVLPVLGTSVAQFIVLYSCLYVLNIEKIALQIPHFSILGPFISAIAGAWLSQHSGISGKLYGAIISVGIFYLVQNQNYLLSTVADNWEDYQLFLAMTAIALTIFITANEIASIISIAEGMHLQLPYYSHFIIQRANEVHITASPMQSDNTNNAGNDLDPPNEGTNEPKTWTDTAKDVGQTVVNAAVFTAKVASVVKGITYIAGGISSFFL